MASENESELFIQEENVCEMLTDTMTSFIPRTNFYLGDSFELLTKVKF